MPRDRAAWKYSKKTISSPQTRQINKAWRTGLDKRQTEGGGHIVNENVCPGLSTRSRRTFGPMTGTSAVQPPLMLPRVSMQAHGARLAGNQSGESTDESAHRLSKNVQTRVSVQTREILGSITPTAELLSPSWHTNSNVPVPVPTQIESISHSNTLGGTIPRLHNNLTRTDTFIPMTRTSQGLGSLAV
ncbi:uncharacterized protein EI90DRAFT_3091540, partial [Cantharellus anzutake]|uniref:uncharacterized protein n=1 Tax=Cantharellus anzutake TaxID=1750568 RepID=UPI001907453D